MSNYKIIKPDGTEREFEDEAEFRDVKSLLEAGEKDFETVTPEDDPETTPDGGAEPQVQDAETTVEPQSAEEVAPDPQDDIEALDQLGESLGTDPLDILPDHMIDYIQGTPAINKRGYAMIAERYGIEVKAYVEEYPWQNDDGRCVARAVANTEDGKQYQDYATASAGDGDMDAQIIELASTRALKRVTGWASGLGIVSYQELASELEE